MKLVAAGLIANPLIHTKDFYQLSYLVQKQLQHVTLTNNSNR